MSFSVWHKKPPFTFVEGAPEQVYQVGAVWVVTDNPARATQAEVDVLLNAGTGDADALSAQLTSDKALDDLGRAIDQGDTKTALTLVKQLLQEKR